MMHDTQRNDEDVSGKEALTRDLPEFSSPVPISMSVHAQVTGPISGKFKVLSLLAMNQKLRIGYI